jgi:hypothetical protein
MASAPVALPGYRCVVKTLSWVVACGLLVFGVLAVHYTIGEGIDHHAEWADRHGMPRPSFAIFVIGLATTVLGAGVGGWLIGRRKRPA